MSTSLNDALQGTRQFPQDGGRWASLGMAYMAEGMPAPAVLALERSVALGTHEAYYPLAQAYNRAGNLVKAEDLMRKLIELNCFDTKAWLEMEYGRLLLSMGRYEEAVRFFIPLSESGNFQLATVAKAVLVDAYSQLGQLDEAAKHGDMQSVWSHMFIASACNRLRQVARDCGASIPRPDHRYPTSDVGVSIDSLGYFGRFGHQLSEYLLLRLVADPLGVPVETPDWVGHCVFELSDPLNRHPRRQIRRGAAQLMADVEARGAEALCGYDYFSPGSPLVWDQGTVDKAREVFRIRPFLLPFLNDLVSRVRAKGQTLIAFHIRLGDRAATLDATHKAAFYLNWLNDNWGRFNQPVLYIASDDMAQAMQHFAAFNPVGLPHFPVHLPDLDWLYDFYVLMQADVVGISQSGFSIMACALNTHRSALFLQPDKHRQTLSSFNPARMNLAGFEPGSTALI